ncbi:MAG TPA: AGE family epimerase/isomerase, partial [Tepidisphaeraceae bacterium]|nr:AGE family epimerase/isomerase [Tepidisphaeraceae bacterium]
HVWAVLACGMCMVFASTQTGYADDADFAPTAQNYRKLADEADQQFRDNILRVWFPRSVDQTARGGFDSSFARDWTKRPGGPAAAVFESRMTWICATIAMRRPELKDQFLPYVRHGVAFLRDRQWDAQDGGPFWELTASLQPAGKGEKHLYGTAFVIYASAAAYEATGDKDALDLSLRTFRWMDEHSHDAGHGGYHESLARDGTPMGSGPIAAAGPAKFQGGGFPIGYKTMNAHIHLLEALTQLYHASKDPLVRTRLEEVLAVVRDKVAVAPGCLNQYFLPDWRPVPDFDSFGHDIETGFLMVEAAEALGRPDDAATWDMARRLVDHALAWGWDEQNGGFYDKGSTFEPAYDRRKTWWVQFEGLNALLLMHERFGHDDPRYFRDFVKTWRFITTHMADKEFGGYYSEVDQAGGAMNPSKANNWKAAYHDGRALLTTADRLRHMAQTVSQ